MIRVIVMLNGKKQLVDIDDDELHQVYTIFDKLGLKWFNVKRVQINANMMRYVYDSVADGDLIFIETRRFIRVKTILRDWLKTFSSGLIVVLWIVILARAVQNNEHLYWVMLAASLVIGDKLNKQK